MRRLNIFWSYALAAGITAIACPAFAGEEGTQKSFPATGPGASTGAESPALPGSSSMHETDRTGTTGPSGSRSFSTESGAVDTEARVAKPAGDHAVTNTDRDLVANIRTRLQGDPELTGVSEDSLHIKVDNGAVILEGQVTNAIVKDQLTAKVKEVAGVRSVENQMTVVAQR